MSVPPGTGRRRRRVRLIPLALLLTFVVEVAVLILVGRVVGIGWTIVMLLATSVLGAWLVRREGRRTWRAVGEAVRSGEMPSRQMADAVLVWVGGALLLAPGFVTDVIGLLAVLPFTRPVARIGLDALIARRIIAVVPGAGGAAPQPGQARVRRTRDTDTDTSDEVVEGEIVDEDD